MSRLKNFAKLRANALVSPLDDGVHALECLSDLKANLKSVRLDLDQLPEEVDAPRDHSYPGAGGGAGAVGIFGILGHAMFGPAYTALLAANVALAAVDEVARSRILRQLESIEPGMTRDEMEGLGIFDKRHETSEKGDQKTVMIGASVSGNPVAAFGMVNVRVVWVRFQPNWTCSGFGLKSCRIGPREDRASESASE